MKEKRFIKIKYFFVYLMLAVFLFSTSQIFFFGSTIKESFALGNDFASSFYFDETKAYSGPFLSDLDYEPESFTQWKKIEKDRNTDEHTIILNVDGQPAYFPKGIAAHATSSVIYDLQQYRDYPYLSMYLGVDRRQAGNGNGVKFNIKVSDDKKTWVSIYQSAKIEAAKDAVFVDLNLQHKRYLMLYADSLGNNACDHSVYADARLHKEGERIIKVFPKLDNLRYLIGQKYKRSIDLPDFKNNFTAFADSSSQQSQELAKLLWQAKFIADLGSESANILYNTYPQNREAMRYIFETPYVLGNMVGLDNIDKVGNLLNTVKAFAAIYNKHKDILRREDENRFYLRLAIAVSQAFGRQELVRFWERPDKIPDPVERFEIYASLLESKVMDYAGLTFKPSSSEVARLGSGPLPFPKFILPSTLADLQEGQKTSDGDLKLAPAAAGFYWSSRKFVDLPLPLLKWVVDARMNNEEFAWLRDYAYTKRNPANNNSLAAMFDAYTYIRYTSGYNYGKDKYYDPKNREIYNNKYKFDSYFDDYPTKIRRLWRVFEEGSVCGGLAKTYTNLAEVFGRPSAVTAQPGHAASLTYVWDNKHQRYKWTIQNNISGWRGSNNEYDYKLLNWGNEIRTTWMNASYTAMATDAVYNLEKLAKANLYLIYADNIGLVTSGYAAKLEYINKALELIPYHEKAYLKLINIYKAENKSSTEFYELAKKIVEVFKYYPLAMVDMLDRIKNNINEDIHKADINLKKIQSLKEAKNANYNNVYQPDICIDMAKSILGENNDAFADFSFDGPEAGKIILNPAYRNTSIRLRYSLDKGKTFTETDKQIIELSAEEISSITAENDIILGLVGTETTYVIDILPGKTVSTSRLVQNELENIFVGDTEALQYRFNDEDEWRDYNTDVDLSGDRVVKVRYRATGRHLASASNQYTFHANAEENPEYDLQHQYIKMKHFTLGTYSSQQSNTADHAAKNMFDGNPLTLWHTAYNANNDGKFITAVFDEPRYISGIDYFPGGRNGYIKKVEIYTSLDGENWTLAYSSSEDLPQWQRKIKIRFDAKPALHIKIHATETYGNSSGEFNKYMSGRYFNFYQDASKKKPENQVYIQYEPSSLTNQNVKATLVLPESYTSSENTHIFELNGTHEFTYVDDFNISHKIEAKVDFIDKEVPTARLVYNPEDNSKDSVCVSLADISDDVVEVRGFPFLVNDDGKIVANDKSSENTIDFTKLCYVFSENGNAEFTLIDKVGNETKLTAKVTWLKKNDNTGIDENVESNGNGETEGDSVSIGNTENKDKDQDILRPVYNKDLRASIGNTDFHVRLDDSLFTEASDITYSLAVEEKVGNQIDAIKNNLEWRKADNKFYDIKLFKNNEEYHSVFPNSAKATVKITTSKAENTPLTVYYYNQSTNTLEKVISTKVIREDNLNVVSFEVNHFSIYILSFVGNKDDGATDSNTVINPGVNTGTDTVTTDPDERNTEPAAPIETSNKTDNRFQINLNNFKPVRDILLSLRADSKDKDNLIRIKDKQPNTAANHFGEMFTIFILCSALTVVSLILAQKQRKV